MRICGYKRPPFYNVGCTGIPRNKLKRFEYQRGLTARLESSVTENTAHK